MLGKSIRDQTFFWFLHEIKEVHWFWDPFWDVNEIDEAEQRQELRPGQDFFCWQQFTLIYPQKLEAASPNLMTRWCLRFFPQKDWEFCFLNNYNAPRYPWFCSGDFKLIPWYVWDDMTGTIVNSMNFWVPDSQMLKLFLVNHHSPWSFSIVLCDVSIYPPSCDIKILRGGTSSKSNMAVYLLKRC